MKRKQILFSVLLLFSVVATQAARVDTIMVKSPSMNKEVQVVYVLPDKALGEEAEACPVVYLLHGYGGNARSWVGLKPELPKIADEKGIIFVCPDGKNSWYWDSPKNQAYRYETFVASELVKYTDKNYATIQRKKDEPLPIEHGGHGALWLAIRHKEIFGAGGSTSGGVDIRPFPKNWERNTHRGDYESDKTLWEQHTVITQVDKIKDGDLALIIDCGEQDFFLEVNKALHKVLLEKNISHDFITRPGGITGYTGNNSIDLS